MCIYYNITRQLWLLISLLKNPVFKHLKRQYNDYVFFKVFKTADHKLRVQVQIINALMSYVHLLQYKKTAMGIDITFQKSRF